jgi:hypothetical protein
MIFGAKIFNAKAQRLKDAKNSKKVFPLCVFALIP